MEHSKPVGLSISFLSFHCNLVHDVQALYAVKPFFFFFFYISSCFVFFFPLFLWLLFSFWFVFIVMRRLSIVKWRLVSVRARRPSLLSTIFLPPIVVRREANSEAADDLLFLLSPLDFIGSTIVLSSRHTQKEKRRATTCISGPTSSFLPNPSHILKDARL